jgi:hypothetical protein
MIAVARNYNVSRELAVGEAGCATGGRAGRWCGTDHVSSVGEIHGTDIALTVAQLAVGRPQGDVVAKSEVDGKILGSLELILNVDAINGAAVFAFERVPTLAGGLNSEKEGGQCIAGSGRDAGGSRLCVERSGLRCTEVDASSGDRTEKVVGLVTRAGLDGMATDDLGEVSADLVGIGDLRGLEVVASSGGVIGDRNLGREGIGGAEEAGDELRGEPCGGEPKSLGALE